MGDIPRPDIICVPEVLSHPQEDIRGRYPVETSWLRECHEQGSIVASVCSGAFLLAEAGLLDDQQVTTHWAFCDAMRERYPRIRLCAQNSLLVSGDDNRLVLAGGGASCQDLALYLIARFAGIECAIQTARVHLVDWHNVGQQPFAHVAQSRQTEDALIARCQVWIAENYHEAAPVASVVAYSQLRERTFTRRFQQATGQTPIEYVQNLRIEEARHLLETGELSVEAIANTVGYEDASFFARLFKRHVGLTPAQYRRRFGGLRQMLRAL
jgi:transcriptional regulator GlxA family with amidase domain